MKRVRLLWVALIAAVTAAAVVATPAVVYAGISLNAID
jgi:hypothetical protein